MDCWPLCIWLPLSASWGYDPPSPLYWNYPVQSNTGRYYITVPYIEGLSESFKNKCKKHGIQVYFKGGKGIKDLLVAPEDKDHITKKSGIIYRYKCDRLECSEEYMSARTFGERFREHLKVPSPIHDHCNATAHTTALDNLWLGKMIMRCLLRGFFPHRN